MKSERRAVPETPIPWRGACSPLLRYQRDERCLFGQWRWSLSSDEGFKPIRLFDQFELTWVLGAIKGVTHDNLS